MWTQPLIFAAASFALALAILLVVRPRHARPDGQAQLTPQIPISETTVTNARRQNSGRATQIISSNVNNPKPPGHSTLLRPMASSQPEVLVPPDEREAFTRFVAVLQERSEVAVALATPSKDEKDGPSSLKPLQIDRLEVKPLEGTESEASGGAKNIR
jgi:hypothetical protein